MIILDNGHRYNKYKLWGSELHQPYDYETNGLLKRLMSKKIIESKNQTIQTFIRFYESSLIFLMKEVDRLKHYKNPTWRNR